MEVYPLEASRTLEGVSDGGRLILSFHFLPCKHKFAIIRKFSDISWNFLPHQYRNSPPLTLDENVLPSVSDVPKYEKTGGNVSCSISPSAFCTSPVNKGCDESSYVQVKFKKCIDSVALILKQIRDVSFDVTSLEVCKKANQACVLF